MKGRIFMPKNKSSYKIAFLFLSALIRPRQKWFWGAFGALLLSSLAAVAQASAVARLIDSALGPAMGLMHALSCYLLASGSLLLFQYLSGVFTARLAALTGQDLKRQLASRLLSAPYSSLLKLQAGDTLQTVGADTDEVCSFLGESLAGLLSRLVMGICALVYFLRVRPGLAFFTFLYTPLGLFFTLTINRKMNALYPVCADSQGAALSLAEQMLLAVPVVKSFQAERRVQRQIHRAFEEVCKTQREIARWNAPMQSACSAAARIPQMLFLLAGGRMVMAGGLSVGMLIALFDLINSIIAPTVYLPFLLNGLNRSIASMLRIKGLLDLPAQPPKPGLPAGEPAILAEGVSFAYENGKATLENFSLKHRGPGLIALEGPSGSGKTTLLDLLSGLYPPDRGKIQIHGGLAVMPQESWIFSDTLRNNLRIARPDASEDEIKAALEKAGALELLESLGDTPLGDGGAGLSGGQKQRLALARVLLSDASVWLLDEPTSALDPETREIILDTVREFSAQKLILAASHEQALLKLAERRVLL